MARVLSELKLLEFYEKHYGDSSNYVYWCERMEYDGYIERIEFDNWLIKDVEEVDIIPRPKCKLIGQNGNIFNLIVIVSKTLKNNGLREYAAEMANRCFNCGSYEEALNVFSDYVEVE